MILPSADPGPTPTVARPFPSSGPTSSGAQSFTFPPVASSSSSSSGRHGHDDDELDLEAEEVRKSALEFMVSLSEARPGMVKRAEGWVGALVRACLGGMEQIDLREEELGIWLEADVSAGLLDLWKVTSWLISE